MNHISFFNCYGCGVCAAACPKKTIKMQINEDGFFQPIVDESNCIECGICLKVCAFNHKEVCQEDYTLYSTAAWSNNSDTRFNCTSGGAAYEIAKLSLEMGYKVCGVRYNVPKKKAEHIIAGTEEELKETIGSKYIQSETVPAFSQFKRGEKYLVVGTPCQIDSLRRFIRMKKWEGNFILMDFFCHSVPSYLLWKKYLEYTGIKKPEIVQFRNKRNGWQDSTTVHISGEGKDWYSALSKGDLFFSFFLGDRCPNECCVRNCKYKQKRSAADIRVGDLWGYKYINNNEGVNALVALSPRGFEVIKKLKTNCTFEPCDFETVAELQMKENCKPTRSWKYVQESLKTDKSIKHIYHHASFLELPDTYPIVIKSMIKSILKSMHLMK